MTFSGSAPVASGNRTIDSILEDATILSGNTVSNIFSASFTDPDNDNFIGIAITATATFYTPKRDEVWLRGS